MEWNAYLFPQLWGLFLSWLLHQTPLFSEFFLQALTRCKIRYPVIYQSHQSNDFGVYTAADRMVLSVVPADFLLLLAFGENGATGACVIGGATWVCLSCPRQSHPSAGLGFARVGTITLVLVGWEPGLYWPAILAWINKETGLFQPECQDKWFGWAIGETIVS